MEILMTGVNSIVKHAFDQWSVHENLRVIAEEMVDALLGKKPYTMLDDDKISPIVNVKQGSTPDRCEAVISVPVPCMHMELNFKVKSTEEQA